MTHQQRFDQIAHSQLPDPDARPSKSQLKREMHALQEIGEELVALSKEALGRLDLPERLHDAVREARNITSHEGKRRQLQYVGKIMRSLHESEVAAIRRALDAIKGVSKAETARLHTLERWRERLLADDDALTQLLAAHPQADAQQLRTLIRNARREQQQQRPPKAFRELFQVLRELLETPDAAGSATVPEDGRGEEYPE
ncbi:ribosome biogenesis factor YjgA [Pandoraea sp.]|uniref:ribosome biogenesis factor YjgA n=1 Tax=Pandoraea sp. TaxID=1883445 RepID=UPI001200CF76|nr:ribosome biogenesis factor YjgA [Pandoraea sp.]TAL57032.1 MAG: DUF615 domain-containing protein [Pandoraea sp.]TAM18075.1 MAG: DUF615 domain-containing protein [Pandoraea sp.]